MINDVCANLVTNVGTTLMVMEPLRGNLLFGTRLFLLSTESVLKGASPKSL